MDLQGTLGNGQIWRETPPVVLQFILVFFHFVVCNCLFAKNIRAHCDIGKMKECFWRYVSLKKFNFLLGTSSLTCDVGSLSLLSNCTESRWPAFLLSCSNAHSYQSICAVKCHSCALATFQICIVYTSHSPFETFRWLCHVYLHGCEIACALTQTFAQCKIFLQGHALHRRSQGGLRRPYPSNYRNI